MHSTLSRGILFGAGILITAVATTARAVDPSPPPPCPLCSPTPAPNISTDSRPSATFAFGDATQVTTRSTTGRFRLVAMHPNETVVISLFVPRIALRSSPSPVALDGGKILSVSTSSLATGGLILISFQAGNLPGLYRVLVPGLGPQARLQFWVENSANPNVAMKAMVLNPNH